MRNVELVISGQGVVIADGDAREDSGGPVDYFGRGQSPIATAGVEMKVDSMGLVQGAVSRISRARWILSIDRSLPSTAITSMRSGESCREVKAQRRGMNNCGFFKEC